MAFRVELRQQLLPECSSTNLGHPVIADERHKPTWIPGVRIRGFKDIDRIPTEHIFGNPPEDAIERALSVGAKRVSCHISHLTSEFVQKAHENDIQVIAWPPNTVEEAKKAMECNVDLICTDRPDIVTKDLLRE